MVAKDLRSNLILKEMGCNLGKSKFLSVFFYQIDLVKSFGFNNGDSDDGDKTLMTIYGCRWLNFVVDDIFWM